MLFGFSKEMLYFLLLDTTNYSCKKMTKIASSHLQMLHWVFKDANILKLTPAKKKLNTFSTEISLFKFLPDLHFL